MSSKNYADTISILEDGKLSIVLKSGKKIYIQPMLVVDTLDELSRLVVRGQDANNVTVDTTVSEVDGIAFSGDFAALEIALRDIAKKSNGLFNGFDREAVPVLAADASTKTEQDIIIEQLGIRGNVTYLDMNLSAGTGFGGFPITIDNLEWGNGTTPPGTHAYPITPTIVNSTIELAALWNANVVENLLESKDATTLYIKEGTEPIPTNANGLVQVKTTAPPFGQLIYLKSFSWSEEVNPVISAPQSIQEKVETLKNFSTNDLGYDAWGRGKFIKDNSIFHGMFTFNVPVSTWYETINGTIGATTNSNSVDGALCVTAGPALNDDTYLRSYRNPRYEPNRGALYSTAGWFENPTSAMTREFGTFTAESGVFFRLEPGGVLSGIVRTTTSGGGTVDDVISLALPAGLDLSKGNVFDIQYQWRGVGNYKFFVNLQEVGNSNYLGTLTQLSMFNPALPVAWNSVNLGSNDAMYFGCVDVSSEGGKDNGKTYGSAKMTTDSGSVALTGYNAPVLATRSKVTVGGLINTRDTLALLASSYSDQRAFVRVWVTRDFSAIIDGTQTWRDHGDGHLEIMELDPGAGTPMTFDTTGLEPVFGCRSPMDDTYATSALFEGRTEIYLTPGDMFVFTLHRETGGAHNGGVTFEFAEAI